MAGVRLRHTAHAFTVAKRLQPPTLEEGSGQLFRVTPTEEQIFKVTEIA